MVLPRGFQDSPHLFGQALVEDLSHHDTGVSTLLQYVDDLLLCSPTKEATVQVMASLLNFLAHQGYRISPSKAQLSTLQVTYLGVALTPSSRALTVNRTASIRAHLPPTSGAEILSFLRLVGFFQHWSLTLPY